MKSLLTSFLAFGLTTSLAAQVVPTVNDEDHYDDYETRRVFDPLSGYNRIMFGFNDVAYTYVAKPVVRGYETVAPAPVRRGLSNFFDNIRYPIRLIGSLAQGKFHRAGLETGKFTVNTLAGLGGFIRQSDHIPSLADIPREDLGQAFGSWGVGHGPWLVLPLLGGNSVRDWVGRAGDSLASPVGWLNRRWVDRPSWEWRTVILTTEILSDLPPAMRAYDEVTADALDPYLAFRDAILSNRDHEVAR